MVSFSRASVCLEPLSSLLDAPRSKRPRLGEALAHARDDAEADLGGDVEREQQGGHVYAPVLWKNMGQKKVVPVAPGAGSRLRDGDVAVE